MSVRGKRGRARRGEGARLREEIVAAATRLVGENGHPGAVSIRALAAAVGVTPPALYLHFRDKDEILLATAERRFEELDHELATRLASSGDELETLAGMARSYVRFGARHRALYDVLVRSSPDKGTSRPPAFEHLVSAAKRCVQAGTLEGDSEELAALLWAALHGLVLAGTKLPDLAGDAATDRFLDVQIEGLLST